MPLPKDIRELRSFLGSITYYNRFIPNLHAVCATLYKYLKKGVKFQWTAKDQEIFDKLRNKLTTSDTLVYNDANKKSILQTDACERGAGAVLCHEFPDGSYRPIAYASRKFNEIEQKYSVTDQEALAIVFGVNKFHQYLYGRRFILLSDHKPLERIFSHNRDTPKVISNRLIT